jgi:uroporphyrinogen-III synthase
MSVLGERWRAVIGPSLIATIGEATAAAVRSAGLRVDAQASAATVPSLIAALQKAFAGRRQHATG